MFIAAGYLSFTTNQGSNQTSTTPQDKVATIGDAALVNSGEFIEKEDKEKMLNSIANNEENIVMENNIESEATNETNTVQTNTNSTDDYFAKSRIERETMYSQMLETYQRLLESATIAQDQKAISQEQINKINQTKNGIMIAENLIKTKGFSDVIIFVNDTSVSVIVQAQELSAEEIAQIHNIVSRELKVEIENIHISKK